MNATKEWSCRKNERNISAAITTWRWPIQRINWSVVPTTEETVSKSFDFTSIKNATMMRKCCDWACKPHPRGAPICVTKRICRLRPMWPWLGRGAPWKPIVFWWIPGQVGYRHRKSQLYPQLWQYWLFISTLWILMAES